MRLEGGFINNLSKVYGIYTLGFLGFVILMAILEQVGVSADAIGWMFVGFTIAIYALDWCAVAHNGIRSILCCRARSSSRF